MNRKEFALWAGPLLLLAAVIAPQRAGAEETGEPAETPASQWVVMSEFGAGYDTNANGSTRQQNFLGFQLDPRFLATESAFGEVSLSAEHTATLTPRGGFISTFQLGHRANPNASFADQTVAAIGTEGVLLRGDFRLGVGISGYSTWLHGHDDERGANLDLNATHEAGDIETAFTLRTSRISNQDRDLAALDVDRYLAAVSVTQSSIGARSGSGAFTLVAGRDAPRRAGSPFGNNRYGIQFSGSWAFGTQAHCYVELSTMRSDYAGRFFGLERKDLQYEAAIALEFEGLPAEGWILAPQLRFVQSDSSVSVFEYDRLEVVLYLRHAL